MNRCEMKSLTKQIREKFKRCPLCNGYCINMKAHMKAHFKTGEITEEEYKEMFRK